MLGVGGCWQSTILVARAEEGRECSNQLNPLNEQLIGGCLDRKLEEARRRRKWGRGEEMGGGEGGGAKAEEAGEEGKAGERAGQKGEGRRRKRKRRGEDMNPSYPLGHEHLWAQTATQRGFILRVPQRERVCHHPRQPIEARGDRSCLALRFPSTQQKRVWVSSPSSHPAATSPQGRKLRPTSSDSRTFPSNVFFFFLFELPALKASFFTSIPSLFLIHRLKAIIFPLGAAVATSQRLSSTSQ